MAKTIFVPNTDHPWFKELSESNQLNVLEISTRSTDRFGRSLSPFKLGITLKSGKHAKVECLYQGSKVLNNGNQYPELYWKAPREAFLDRRVKGVTPVGFRFFEREFPIKPKHSFYNWLYICGLLQRKDNVFEKLLHYDGFSDIFYNPKKDLNCQARATAIYVSLIKQGLISNDTPSSKLLELLY